ncbi:MAG: hypothetical protein IJL94_01015 [Erysipelotrichaceae bacterium]|nr:hypothetical protein [Erysipelotrichaceae bacterium]
MEKIKNALLYAGIFIFAIVLYLAMPTLYKIVVTNSQGTSGLIFLLTVSVILTAVFYLMGQRGKGLLYVFVLIIGIALMIWLYFNYRSIDTYISNKYGQMAATGIFLAIVLAVWLFTKFFL